MKRLLVLGAGPFQVPGIRKARELGHEVITLDYLPDNVGHKYSHDSVLCSTTDQEGVLKAAKKYAVDGICTFSSDVAVPTVGYVCDALGLRGVSAEAARIMAAKDRFRTFLEAEGLNHPRFTSGTTISDIMGSGLRLKPPVLFKPIDTSGSRGVIRVDDLSGDVCLNAFSYAKSYSRSGYVCIEEFLEGIEVGGDGILVDGRIAFLAITHKYLNGFVVTGHSIPTNIDSAQQLLVVNELEACCRALGYGDGPLNFDVMVGSDKATVIEMSARNGGNGLPAVIERSTGVDVEQTAIQMALGINPQLTAFEKTKGSASLVFGSSQTGIIGHISSREFVMDKVPEVYDLILTLESGDLVESFEHNGNMLGYALFDCAEPESYGHISQMILSNLAMEVS